MKTGGNSKQKGQSLAEYGLALALVAVFCIAGLQTLGGSLSDLLTNMGSSIAAAASGNGGGGSGGNAGGWGG